MSLISHHNELMVSQLAMVMDSTSIRYFIPSNCFSLSCAGGNGNSFVV